MENLNNIILEDDILKQYQTIFEDYKNSNGKVVYVDQKNKNEKLMDGKSWKTAFSSLDKGIESANSGDSIFVAMGEYSPQSNHNLIYGEHFRIKEEKNISMFNENHFRLKNGVSIFGGFDGTESEVYQRDINKNKTVLKGNGRHVLCHVWELEAGRNKEKWPKIEGIDSTAVLDGFTITGGNANYEGRDYRSFGGGVLNLGAKPTFRNCTFSINFASCSGGAVANFCSHPKFYNCNFISNSSNDSAGAVFNQGESCPTFFNCIFISNSSESCGAILNTEKSISKFYNTMFIDNIATKGDGGAVGDSNSPSKFYGCIFKNNKSLQNGYHVSISQSKTELFKSIYIENGELKNETNGVFSYSSQKTRIFPDLPDDAKRFINQQNAKLKNIKK